MTDELLPLTTKQEAFVYWYTTNGPTLYSGTESAKAAGYSGNNYGLSTVGSENLRKPNIYHAIQEIFRAAFSSSEVTVEKVLMDLEHHRQLALGQGNIPAANQASIAQGKHLAMFSDKIEHIHSIEDTSTADLVGLLQRLSGKVDGLYISGTAGTDGAEEGDDASGSGAGKPH